METERPQMDWDQVVANGGPPCFSVEGPQYCGRAERWQGHGNAAFHDYVSLEALLARSIPSGADKKHVELALSLLRQLVSGENALRDLDAFPCNNPSHNGNLNCECFWEKCEAWAKADSERINS